MNDTPFIDNKFHKDAIMALKIQDPAMALVFGFENTQRRSLAANLICLSGELQNALRIPKEPMLAAIRVQWWYDTLAVAPSSYKGNIAPLVVRLQKHIQNDDIERDDILKLIEAWQACTMDETASTTQAWSICWQLVGHYLGGHDTGDSAQKIAPVLHATPTTDPATIPSLDNAFFGNLRKQVQESRQWWLYFAAIIGYHKHMYGHDAMDHDHLLVWRLLRWRLFGFKIAD
ncbi:hypothetical protein [Candidatus Puniceispirillum marinum]|nr:hypothetical protein [Candidatus Puniceispirillum marinum]